MNDNGQFWLVWNVNGRQPTRAHASMDAANAEAMRLARQCPEAVFVVLEAKHAFKSVERPVERMLLSEIDHIPF
jgi:hypothetical protein